jgi:glycosyltransferase involved in cell wall biosynthesis
MPEAVSEPTSEIGSIDDLDIRPGALDGITIMRYAHIGRDRESGGVEQYLRQLNRSLLERHRLTIVQTHLATDDFRNTIEIEHVGAGRILWVPVSIRERPWSLVDLPIRMGYLYGRAADLHRQRATNRFDVFLLSLRSVFRHRAGHLRYGAMIFSDHLSDLLGRHNVNLVALHWMSYDTGALISEALTQNIPFVFINHFDNARFASPETRTLIRDAAGIGAVSLHGIPEHLQGRCVDLSDAIDVIFFNPDRAALRTCEKDNIILLPARIERNKGHRDLLQAAYTLKARGIAFTVCFAGANDSESLCQELRGLAAELGLADRVVFVGEKTADEMRDWYAQSSVVVLPSYAEGLPRVLLEAQAMKKPVVTYECGGTPQALLRGETGFLVKKGDIETLASAISELLVNTQARSRMGERGREFVLSKFSVTTLVRRHEVFYLRALCSGSRIGSGSWRSTGKTGNCRIL